MFIYTVLEFLVKCNEIYQELSSGSHRPGQVVVVPTSDSKSKHHKNTDKITQQQPSVGTEGVDSQTFYDEMLHHIVHNNATAKTIRYCS